MQNKFPLTCGVLCRSSVKGECKTVDLMWWSQHFCLFFTHFVKCVAAIRHIYMECPDSENQNGSYCSTNTNAGLLLLFLLLLLDVSPEKNLIIIIIIIIIIINETAYDNYVF